MTTLEAKLQQLHSQLQATKPPPFGHACKKLYSFDDEYKNVNNGSFGTCPNHVLAAYNLFVAEAERRPDLWYRVDFRKWMQHARAQVAQLVQCPPEDLVLLTNATTGVNAVLRGMAASWSVDKQEAILVYDTVYGACGKTAQYIVDSNPALKLSVVHVPITYPVSHDEVLRRTKETIVETEKRGIKVRIAIVDAISSLPGVIVPWEDIVKLLRQHNVLSLVDGAHAVGQIPLNLKEADPDFFISNCHKWLSAHRGCAFLYAPKRTQHLVPGMPTSHYYITTSAPPPEGPALIPTDAPSNFVAVWESNGTQDLSSFLSLPAAIEFRQWLGGEDKIMQYNNRLARRGGEIVTQRLGHGSRVMDTPNGDLTAAMVNVSIPVDLAKVDKKQCPNISVVAAKIQTVLASRYPVFAPFYVHGDQVCMRLSAQVWLEESDFEWLADRIDYTLGSLGWAQGGEKAKL